MNYSPHDESIKHLSSVKGKRVLFGIMDWGLGHATRSVPVIRALMEKNEVILASAGRSADFLRDYFPYLVVLEKPAYAISYSPKLPLVAGLLIRLPGIFQTIKDEKKWVEKQELMKTIDLVLSDNCYGFYSQKAFSIIITHQMMLKTPFGFEWAQGFVHRKIKDWIDVFDECWIPDFADNTDNLSGDLSHRYPPGANVKFIGSLSRFSGKMLPHSEKDVDMVYLISGPEPSRTQFFNDCLKEAISKKYKAAIVSGLPGPAVETHIASVSIYNHLPDDRLVSLLSRAVKIKCRSGYSTIMDLNELGLSADFIPTPGQTEQEYLAKYLQKKKLPGV